MIQPEGESIREGETIAQPELAQKFSREQSVPKGVEQHPEAPKLAGYILTRPLGKGAFAQVWRAWQIRTRKTLAVKVFSQSHGVNWLYLQREVERLIRLDKHPNIVSLFDADLTGDPPYYAMDLMEGGSLERYVGSQERPPEGAVARWAEEISDALAYVHAKGLLHCDLKPANVLLDEQGHARVADFGQSRILTESAGALGTLFYMAPEQAVVAEDSVELHPDVRWDVFALGTTLYAVLAGRLPFGEQRSKLEAAVGLKARLTAYRDAVAGSRLLWDPAAPPAEEDLRAIIDKCAAPSPDARYEGVTGVKADLDAMRRRFPVSPLAGRRGYRARRFIQRNLALVVLGAAALAGLVFTGTQVLQARSDAVRRLAFSYAMRGRQFSELGDDASAAAYYVEAYRLYPSPLAQAAALAHVRQLPVPLRVYPHKWGIRAVAFSGNGKRLLTGSWDKGASLWDTATKESERKVLPHDASVTAVDLSADGARGLTADKDGHVQLWNAVTGAPGPGLAGHSGEVTLVKLSPDGKVALTAGLDRTARLWSAVDGKPLGPALGNDEEVAAAAFSPDGSRLAVGAAEGTVRLWQSDNQVLRATLKQPGGVASLLFSPDGGRLAALGKDGTVEVWDLSRLPPAGVFLPVRSAASLAFSPDGSRLLTGSADGAVQLWEPGGSQRAALTVSAPAAVRAVAFTPNGLLAAGDEDGTVRFWETASGQPVGGTLRNSGAVDSLAVSSDGLMMTAASDGTVRLWNVPEGSGPSAPAAPETPPVRTPAGRDLLAFLPRELVALDAKTADVAGLLKTLGAKAGVTLVMGKGVAGTITLPRQKMPLNELFTLALSQNHLTATQVGENILRIADAGVRGPEDETKGQGETTQASRAGASAQAGTPARLRVLRHGEGLTAISFNKDGSELLTAGGSKGLLAWSATTGEPLNDAPKTGLTVSHAVFSKDGSFVMAGSKEGRQVWEWKGGKTATLPRAGELLASAFNADGSLLATGQENGQTKLWRLKKGSPADDSSVPGGPPVGAVAFSPDGRFLAAGAADGASFLARVDATSFKKLIRLAGQVDWISALAFSPDGKRIVAGSWDTTARVWDVERCVAVAAAAEAASIAGQKKTKTPEELEKEKADRDAGISGASEVMCEPTAASFRHAADVSAVAFDPSSKRVASADWGGTAVVWDALTGQPLGSALRHPGGISSIAFSPAGKTVLTGGWDGTARLWDSETGEPIWRPVAIGAPVTKVAFSPNGSLAAAIGADGNARLWEGPLVRALALKPQVLALRALLGGQRRVNDKGDIETVPAEDLPALREKLDALEGQR